VRPGDLLTAHWKVLETKSSRSRPEMGLAHMRILLVDQRGESAYEQIFWAMFGRRDAGASAKPEPRSTPQVGNSGKASPATSERGKPLPAASQPLFFDELTIGETHEIGSYRFTAENIIRFAKEFDPQPFHVDPEAAAKSHFGALCASGWHTGAACMRKLIDRRNALRDGLVANGVKPPAMGSSPGFKDLVWQRPVYVGDEVSFASTLVAKRASASRPGWGLIFSRNTGTNQKGELVYSVTGSVFIETRKA
jgi:acyl dehydratase